MGRRPTPHFPSFRSTARAIPSSYVSCLRNRQITPQNIHVEQRLERVTALNPFEPVAVQQRIFFSILNVSLLYVVKCLVRTLFN